MSYKLGFLKLRFSVEEGSKKEKFIKSIIQTEDNIKEFLVKSLKGINSLKTKHSIVINNQVIYVRDLIFSRVCNFLITEMKEDCYGLSKIDFKENDIVIDIGANIGIVSIYLAKKHPFLKIYSFEPCKLNYESFIDNIKINNINKETITPFNCAVTKDGRNIVMEKVNPFNTGACSINFNDKVDDNKDIVKSTTLDNIIEKVLAENKQNHIKLLKMDCEFSEYEILKNTKIENLKKISYLSAEFHKKGDFGNPDELEAYVKQYIPNVTITKCESD